MIRPSPPGAALRQRCRRRVLPQPGRVGKDCGHAGLRHDVAHRAPLPVRGLRGPAQPDRVSLPGTARKAPYRADVAATWGCGQSSRSRSGVLNGCMEDSVSNSRSPSQRHSCPPSNPRKPYPMPLHTATMLLSRSSPSARLDAELLLEYVTGLSRTNFRANPERGLPANAGLVIPATGQASRARRTGCIHHQQQEFLVTAAEVEPGSADSAPGDRAGSRACWLT